MTNYTKNTNFTAKDALVTGNPLKKILGSLFDAEFDEIATCIATKEDSANKGVANGYVGLGASSEISVAGSVSGTAFIPTGVGVPANGVYLPAANTLGFASNTTARGSVNSTGNWALVAPTAGVGLAVNGFAGATTATFQDSAIPKIGLLVGATERAFLSYTEATFTARLDSDGPVVLAPNNTAALSISSAGNTTLAAPLSGATLQVAGLGGSATTQAWTGGSTVALAQGTTASETGIGTSSSHAFNIFSAGANRMQFGTSGNVTLAAPSSGTALTINGSANSLQFSGASTSQQYARFTNTGGDGAIGIDSSAGGQIFSGVPAYAMGIGTFGATSLSLGTNNTERVRVGTGGNVTIAAPSSGTTLALNSGAVDVGLSISNGSGQLTFQAGGASSQINTPGAWGLDLQTNTVTRLAINSTGNVTISAPSSGTALSVAANATSPALNIDSTTAATAYQRFQSNGTSIGDIGDQAATFGSGSGSFGITSRNVELALGTNSTKRIVVSSAGNVTINAASSGDELTVTGSVVATSTISDQAGDVRIIPQNAQTASYTCVLSDAGKHIYHASGAGAGDTYTIPANSSVAYTIGTAITFINRATDTVSIAITTDTLTHAGSGATGTRTLSAYGVATAIKITATEWIISGTGLT